MPPSLHAAPAGTRAPAPQAGPPRVPQGSEALARARAPGKRSLSSGVCKRARAASRARASSNSAPVGRLGEVCLPESCSNPTSPESRSPTERVALGCDLARPFGGLWVAKWEVTKRGIKRDADRERPCGGDTQGRRRAVKRGYGGGPRERMHNLVRSCRNYCRLRQEQRAHNSSSHAREPASRGPQAAGLHGLRQARREPQHRQARVPSSRCEWRPRPSHWCGSPLDCVCATPGASLAPARCVNVCLRCTHCSRIERSSGEGLHRQPIAAVCGRPLHLRHCRGRRAPDVRGARQVVHLQQAAGTRALRAAAAAPPLAPLRGARASACVGARCGQPGVNAAV